jgi:hypothetical protein
MFEWSDVRFLPAVSRTGLKLAAVRGLGVDATMVAPRIHALERALIPFLCLAATCLLAACATTSMPSAAPGENEGISGYVACLDAAARRIDDGRSDVASVAATIKGMCATRFPEPAKAPGATTRAAARQKSEARQMELSTMVVQDLRGQP